MVVVAPVVLRGIKNESDEYIGHVVVDGELEHHADHLLGPCPVAFPLATFYGDGLHSGKSRQESNVWLCYAFNVHYFNV